MTDLSKIKPVEQVVDVLHPGDKSELGIKVTIMSPADNRLDSLRRMLTQKKLAEQAKGRVPKVEEMRDDRIKILHAAITAWDWGDNDWKGDTPELPNIRELKEMDVEASWLIAQIDKAFGDDESFFTNAANN